MATLEPKPPLDQNGDGPLSIDLIDFNKIIDRIKALQPENSSNWFNVQVMTHALNWYVAGSRKNRSWASTDGLSYARHSKYFYDRPSAQGFRKGLGINRQYLPGQEGLGGLAMLGGPSFTPTAFKLPGFTNGSSFLVGLDFEGFVPFYYSPWFLVMLNFLGLAHISLILVLCCIPGKNRFMTNGKTFQLKVPRIMLF
jgi:hypothetical protein